MDHTTITLATGVSATGLLKTGLTGGTTSIIIQTSSISVTFVITADLRIGDTVVSAANINAATAVTATGSLITKLIGSTTSLIVSTAAGAVFLNTADVMIGDTNVLYANVNTATATSATGTLAVELDGGATTQILISSAVDVNSQTLNGQTFDATHDLIVGGVTINAADLTAATSTTTVGRGDYTHTTGVLNFANTESTKVFSVDISQDDAFEYPDEEFDVVLLTATYNGNTLTRNPLRPATATAAGGMTLHSSMSLNGASILSGIVVNGASRAPEGFMAVNANVWTLTIASQSIAEEVGVAVTQGSVTGTVKIALNGASTTVIISTAAGAVFVATTDVVIGSTTVIAANIATAVLSSSTELWKLELGVVGTNGTIKGTRVLETILVESATVNMVAPLVVSRNAFWMEAVNPMKLIKLDLDSMVVSSNTLPATCSSAADASVLMDSSTAMYGTNALADGSQASTIVKVTLSTLALSTTTTSLALPFIWVMNINNAGITEMQNVQVAQNNQWTMGIASQTINQVAGVPVSQNEWTLSITSQTISEISGITVTQGLGGAQVSGTLKIALVGSSSSIVISTSAGVTFLTTEDLLIGTTTVLASTVTTATNSVSNIGTLTTSLTGASTSIVIQTALDVTFLTNANLVIGTGGTATTVAVANINTATHSTSATGTLATALQNEWTVAINSQAITESSGVTVTQINSGVTVTGTLKTTVAGATTSVIIQTTSGVVFLNSANVEIGSTTVLASNVNTATHTGTTTAVTITSAVNQVFLTTVDLIIGSTTVSAADLTSVTAPGICCATSTTETGYSIWITTSGTVYRIQNANNMAIIQTSSLSNIQGDNGVTDASCNAPVSILQTGYYIYVGCTNGNIVKIRSYDLKTPDVIAPQGTTNPQLSAVDDGTYGYFAYGGSSTTASVVQLHGSIATGTRVGIAEEVTQTLSETGLFIFADSRYAYWYRATSKVLSKLSLVAPPRTTITIADDGDAGTIQFQQEAFFVRESNGTSSSDNDNTGEVVITRTGRDTPSGAMKVSYRTGGGTASPSVDYIPIDQAVEVVGTTAFSVTALHDNLYEYPDETVNVYLTQVSYSGVILNTIGELNTAVVTIGDDGDAGTLSFSALNYQHSEAIEGYPATKDVEVTVVRTGRHLPDGDISVSYRSVDSTAVSTGSIEWTLAVLNTPTIDETAGVTVSQGGVDKGTLKTTLSGDASNVIITTASDVTVLANADVTIGTTVLVLANINTATASSAVSIGTLDYTPVTGNLQFATGELTKSFTVSILQDEYYEYPDELFQMELYDIKYQAVPSLSYKTWTMTLNSVGITEANNVMVKQLTKWTLDITAQGITQAAGVTVTQGSSTGTLQNALSNEWALAITSQDITENAGVVVSQAGSSCTGTLKTALTGATSSVTINIASSITCLTTGDLTIGSAVVLASNINAASNNGAVTSIIIHTLPG